MRLIVFLVLAVLVIVSAIPVVTRSRQRAEWKRTAAALQSLSRERVETAVQAFARDRKVTENTVSLRELVSGGYLRAEDVHGLEEGHVTIFVTTNEVPPSGVWVRVRTSGGADIVAMEDGSIQMVLRR